MRSTKRMRLLVAALAVGLLTAACGGGGSGGTGDGGGSNLRIFSTEPASLMPTAANDEPSILVIRQMFRGLVKYDPETGEPVLDLAKSITSENNKVWTIEIKKGYTFTNGEPVDADAFLRSWNFTGNINNNQVNSYFMSRIKGFEAMQKKSTPPDATFSGLKKIDEYTFQVTLDSPFVGFPAILGYSGFFPMAKECLQNWEQCQQKPITNGPYKMAQPWDHNTKIVLEKWEGWAGETKGKADKLTFKIYENISSGFAAYQAGELDVMYTVPPEELGQLDQYKDTLLTVPGDGFTYLVFPLYEEPWDNKKLRQAFSLAINRDLIIEKIFNGAYTPATGIVAPTFEGARKGVCEYCLYDPQRAKKLFKQSGVTFDKPITLWANGGAGHEKWMQAVGNMLNKTLGIEYKLNTSISDFGQYLQKGQNHGFTGPFRLGWGPDYPIMETYLTPLYGTNASSNYSTYSNPKFDQLIKKGDRAPTLEKARDYYQKAADLIVEDMPIVPLWFGKEHIVWSDRVEEMAYNTISGPNYGQIQLK